MTIAQCENLGKDMYCKQIPDKGRVVSQLHSEFPSGRGLIYFKSAIAMSRVNPSSVELQCLRVMDEGYQLWVD